MTIYYFPFDYSTVVQRQFRNEIPAGGPISPPAGGWNVQNLVQLAGAALAAATEGMLDNADTMDMIRARASIGGEVIPSEQIETFAKSILRDATAAALVIADKATATLAGVGDPRPDFQGSARWVGDANVEFVIEGDEGTYTVH